MRKPEKKMSQADGGCGFRLAGENVLTRFAKCRWSTAVKTFMVARETQLRLVGSLLPPQLQPAGAKYIEN
jgi:hypothetical protein